MIICMKDDKSTNKYKYAVVGFKEAKLTDSSLKFYLTVIFFN